MHGTKEGRHSNHGPQLVLKLNAFNVFSGKSRGQTKQKKCKGKHDGPKHIWLFKRQEERTER